MKLNLLILIFIVYGVGCSKNDFVDPSGAKLYTSTTEMDFDTLFTTTGSITRVVTIYNQSRGKLRIDKISLRNADHSFFRINADGRPGHAIDDIEVDKGDSVYVFVSIRIDSSDKPLPFLVEDTLDISYGSNVSHVALRGWGQNALFMRSKIIVSDTTWTKERPIVIYGGLVVARDVTLNIEKGTRVYLHADAPIIIDGRLVAIGERFDSTKILFRGDRLDEYYKDLPASWPGIYFTGNSHGNFLKHVDLRHAYQGLVTEAESGGSDFRLRLEQVIVDNCYDAGIIAVNSSVSAINCLFSNSGRNVMLLKGGRHSFIHCTNVAVGTVYIPHKQPVLTITDFVRKENEIESAAMTASFVNCIFWGSGGGVDDEVVVLRESELQFESMFQNCIWKVASPPANAEAAHMINDVDPEFLDVGELTGIFDFHLKQGSRGINEGATTGVNVDLEDSPRTNIPDIGAYESTF